MLAQAMLAQVQVPKSHFGQLPAPSLPSLVSLLYWALHRPIAKDPEFTRRVKSD